MRRSVISMALAGSFAAALPAAAQPFPSKPVRLVVAYAPGGTGDVVARVIADKLGAALGQTVVVENRAGASGAIGTQIVVNAAPDGHTLLVGQTAEIVVNQYWIKGLTYDPKDLAPVALATVVPLALTVPGKAPYASLAEMLKAIAASGKPLSFASAGTGTPGPFRRRVSEREAAGQAHARALQGRRARRSTTSSAGMSTCIFPAFRR